MKNTTQPNLLELADRVEAGNYGDYGRREEVARALGYDTIVLDAIRGPGSLDSAKSLHDAVLPGWTVGKLEQRQDIGTWWIKLGGGDAVSFGESPNPAAAWVAAILRAKAGAE